MLSISIVTYKIDREEFSSVLLSLNKAILALGQTQSARVMVTIVDNGMQEALLKEIIAGVEEQSAEEENVSYKLISGLKNIGYGRANNLVIRASQAEYHLVLNPDVILDQNCLVEGLSYLKAINRENPEDCVSAVSPYATDGNGKWLSLCKRYPSVLILLLRGFAPQVIKKYFKDRLNKYELRDRIQAEMNSVVEDVPLISGCFMLCNTEALQKSGGFNDNFFLHFEDLALSIELAKNGKLNYLPAMKIEHYGGNSARKGLKHILIFIRSGIKFFNIYGWKFV